MLSKKIDISHYFASKLSQITAKTLRYIEGTANLTQNMIKFEGKAKTI